MSSPDWWGWVSLNSELKIEEISTANGWTGSYNSPRPVYNTNNLYLNGSGTNYSAGVGINDKVPQGYTVKFVAKGEHGMNGVLANCFGYYGKYSTKAADVDGQINANTMTLYTVDINSADQYVSIFCSYSASNGAGPASTLYCILVVPT